MTFRQIFDLFRGYVGPLVSLFVNTESDSFGKHDRRKRTPMN